MDPICIGSVLWDIIGRTNIAMHQGNDVPGTITRLPGGVAYNIARQLTRFGLHPILLTALGNDREGHSLIDHCNSMQMQTDYIYISQDLRTDSYMAIEDGSGLMAAIADARSLELVGDKILTALQDGRLGSDHSPYSGMVVLDGNLTEDLLNSIAHSPLFRACDLRVVPASPGKAHRLTSFFAMKNATFYVNRYEAEILCHKSFASAHDAALAMVERGAARAIVTDGAAPVCDAVAGGDPITLPVPVAAHVRRITGAGDTLLAAHIHSEINGDDRISALNAAVIAASHFVSGDD